MERRGECVWSNVVWHDRRPIKLKAALIRWKSESEFETTITFCDDGGGEWYWKSHAVRVRVYVFIYAHCQRPGSPSSGFSFRKNPCVLHNKHTEIIVSSSPDQFSDRRSRGYTPCVFTFLETNLKEMENGWWKRNHHPMWTCLIPISCVTSLPFFALVSSYYVFVSTELSYLLYSMYKKKEQG